MQAHHLDSDSRLSSVVPSVSLTSTTGTAAGGNAEAQLLVSIDLAAPIGSPDAAQPDDALLERCRNGEPRAWQELVVRYQRLVYSIALRQGLPHEDAADVTQSVFVALLGALDTVQDARRLPFWLMTVTRRQAWRVRRQHDHERSLGDAVVAAVDPIAEWEQSATVRHALAQLDPPCRQLLVALYFDPRSPSYAQIAAELGKSVGAVGPFRGRCLNRLRAILEV